MVSRAELDGRIVAKVRDVEAEARRSGLHKDAAVAAERQLEIERKVVHTC